MWESLAEHIDENWVLIIRQVVGAGLVVLLMMLLHRLLKRGFRHVMQRKDMPEPLINIMLRFAKYIVVAVAVLLVLQVFGVLQNAWAALTVILAMVAIGFVAVWSVLSNTLCSVILLISRPFNIGDTVELTPENLGGKVVNFNLLYTTLRVDTDTSGRETVQVPNNLFFQRAIRRTEGTDKIGLDEQLQVEADAKV